MPTEQDVLIIAASEAESNLYYATRFLAPDPFIFLRIKGEKILLMSDLEVDRARATATVDTVLSYSDYESRVKRGGTAAPTSIDVVDEFLKERGVTRLLVPEHFAFEHGRRLQARGYELSTRREPFFEERAIKTQEEIGYIEAAQRAVESAVRRAIDLLGAASVRDGLIVHEGEPVTSERIKKLINVALMEQDCVAQHTIIAGGVQACDPHNEGTGPLKANEPIVMDVFPRHMTTRYFADMSRTVVKGRPSRAMQRLYDTVLAAQEEAIASVRDGADGQEIHAAVLSRFEAAGFKTGRVQGRMQGFFHGTGHGVGIDIHESPRISRSGSRLEAGQVVTVEPGLYYPEIGATRIEDMVLVTADGCRNLTRFPKILAIE
ncbi:MAG TPA: Xaa-Pro peptidase family protein [Nitrospirales bacterium]|nr:Xaa-Pro peptidase family protein [Nitrospirales bacterium]